MDDRSFIEQARLGDLEAYNNLVLEYQDQVYHQAYRLLGETQAAEDITQEAFILAYKKLKLFNGGSFKAWLLRIVTNLCLDELRRWKRRPDIPLEPVDEEGDEIESPFWMADPGATPEEQAEKRELREALNRGLLSLPVDLRLAVILVDIQELDYHEAAEVMGVPIGTVKSRLSRGRVKLRESLKRPDKNLIGMPSRDRPVTPLEMACCLL